jgi:DNA-binding NarL/FixJ family response regulator
MKKIRIMLVDDHILMRVGLTFTLNNQPDMQVVAEADDGSEAVERYEKYHPDVVLLDLRMPKKNGIETIGCLRQRFGSVPILVLSNYSAGDEVAAAIEAGARGFVAKDTPLAELLEAIRQINAGAQYLSSEVAHRLAGRISSQLSNREIEVLRLMGKGFSNKGIGVELDLAESTVKVHAKSIFSKLNVSDRTQAILSAVKRGIIQID